MIIVVFGWTRWGRRIHIKATYSESRAICGAPIDPEQSRWSMGSRRMCKRCMAAWTKWSEVELSERLAAGLTEALADGKRDA